MPYLMLVSKQSTYMHDDYHQSSLHFIDIFSSIKLPFNLTKLAYFYQSNFYLTKEIFFINGTFIYAKKYSHGSSFYLRKQLFSSIQLLLNRKLRFIHPASIYGKNYFDQSSFY